MSLQNWRSRQDLLKSLDRASRWQQNPWHCLKSLLEMENRAGVTGWIISTDVNEWDADAKKKWIRARFTGRAATAFRRLPEADRETFDKIVAALTKRFKPECRKELYIAEFQGRRKRRNEDWAAFGEDLKTLVEKAYPALQAEAQELLVLSPNRRSTAGFWGPSENTDHC